MIRSFHKQRRFSVFCFLFLKLYYARGNYIRQRLSPQFVTAFIYSVCHLKTVVLFSLSLIKREIVSRGRPTMHHSFVRMCLKLYISLHYFFFMNKKMVFKCFWNKKRKRGKSLIFLSLGIDWRVRNKTINVSQTY